VHAHTHAGTYAHTHGHTHTCMHARTHTHTHLHGVVVVFVLRLLDAHRVSDDGDLETQARHALRLADHGQDLGVKVHVEVVALRVPHQQGGLETGLGRIHLETQVRMGSRSQVNNALPSLDTNTSKHRVKVTGKQRPP
jgi:hypothetical protein